MTTIAYHPDWGIAGDRQISQRRTAVGETTKIGRAGNGRFLWGCTGHLALINDFRFWVDNGPAAPKHRGKPDTDAWLGEMPRFAKEDETLIADVLDPTRIFVVDRHGIETMTVPYFALGSGRDFALGALAAGAGGPVVALQAATAHCVHTGRGVDFLPWEEKG